MLPQPKMYEQSLTKDEVQMFESLADKEAIHNVLGEMLSKYRESIIETRNQFVGHLAAKYKMENPSQLTYDPIRQKIVSVFHPDLKAHKIVSRPYAFTQLASEMTMDAIKKLSECLRLSKVK